MAIQRIEGGRAGFSPPPPNVNFQNVKTTTQGTNEILPLPITNKQQKISGGKEVNARVDLQKFKENLKNKFKELENIPSFPRNLLVKLDIGIEFGIFVIPEQLFSKLVDDNNQTLKISPPEFLLRHRVLMERLIAQPAFDKLINRSGEIVNVNA